MAENNTVGWVGLGKIGVPMAGHLLDAGFAVTVHNHSAGPEAALRDAGEPGGACGKHGYDRFDDFR
jgi:3-hydroxyisobutyrate dehydrogenase-like beta-hydroxyacid dehydrogenase